jgi:hypothetical protein
MIGLHHGSFKNLQALSPNPHYHLKFTSSSSRKLSNHARFNHESSYINRQLLDVSSTQTRIQLVGITQKSFPPQETLTFQTTQANYQPLHH